MQQLPIPRFAAGQPDFASEIRVRQKTYDSPAMWERCGVPPPQSAGFHDRSVLSWGKVIEEAGVSGKPIEVAEVRTQQPRHRGATAGCVD